MVYSEFRRRKRLGNGGSKCKRRTRSSDFLLYSDFSGDVNYFPFSFSEYGVILEEIESSLGMIDNSFNLD